MFKQIIKLLGAVLVLSIFSGCNGSSGGGNGGGEQNLLQASNLSVQANTSTTLNVSLPTSASSPVIVTFNSNNPQIATVTSSCEIPTGLTTCTVQVTGVNVGKAIIVSNANNYVSAETIVTVSLSPTISLNNLQVEEGYSGTISAILSLAPTSPVTINFNSNNIAVAKVDSSCTVPAGQTICSVLVTGGNSVASALITATAPGYILSSPSTVNVIPGPTLSLNSHLSVAVGYTNVLTATVSQVSSSPVTVTFGSTDTNIATVDVSCTIPAFQNMCAVGVQGESIGMTYIDAGATGYVLSSPSTVNVTTDPTLSLNPSNLSVADGYTGVMTASVSQPVTVPTAIVFGTGNNSVATISPSCTISIGQNACTTLVDAISIGAASISASANGYNPAAATVTVSSDPTITLTPSPLNIEVGYTYALTATLQTAAASPITVTFGSGNAAVAVVSDSCTVPTGQFTCSVAVTGESVATTSISASAAGYVLASAASVNVSTAPAFTLTPSPLNITNGKTGTLLATLPSAATSSVVIMFGSSNSAIATVGNSCTVAVGLTQCSVVVTGQGVGSTSIGASAAGYSSQRATVNVGAGPTLSLNGPINVTVGSTSPLQATLSESVPAPVVVSFGSGNEVVAGLDAASCTVESGGNTCTIGVIGESVGLASISASATGYGSATATANVIPSPTIALNPPNSNTHNGGTIALTASIPANPASPVTVTFGSSDTAIATIPNPTCTIATTENSCTVTVTGGSTFGDAVISASATGYRLSTPAVVAVTNFPVSLSLSSNTGVLLTHAGGTSVLTATSPFPIFSFVTFNSGDTAVATVQPFCFIFVTSCSVTVTSAPASTVAETVVITATAPFFLSRQFTYTLD